MSGLPQNEKQLAARVRELKAARLNDDGRSCIDLWAECIRRTWDREGERISAKDFELLARAADKHMRTAIACDENEGAQMLRKLEALSRRKLELANEFELIRGSG